MVENGAFSHKYDYVTIFKETIHLEGHPTRITDSRVTAILLNGWIKPSFGVLAVEGLRSTGVPHLVKIKRRYLLCLVVFCDLY